MPKTGREVCDELAAEPGQKAPCCPATLDREEKACLHMGKQAFFQEQLLNRVLAV